MRSKIIPAVIGIMLIASSCKKEKTNTGNLKAVFSYSVSGFVVNFTNFTDFTNYTGPYPTYSWDFGDGDSSSAASPSHIYSKKGSYVVTLKASKGDEVSTFFDSVNVIGPHITTDGDFSDWDHVEYTYVSPDSSGGSDLLAMKAFVYGDSLYFYVEGVSGMMQNVTHFYFDTDKNPSTGYMTSDYSAGSGAEYLYEGDFYWWGSISKYSGTGTDWTWSTSSDFGLGASFSPITPLGNGRDAIEFAFAKSALGNVKNSVGFAVNDLDAGWNVIGALPAKGQDTSKFIQIEF